jgi:hypothetical protein
MFQSTISRASIIIIICVSLQGYLNMQGLDKKDVDICPRRMTIPTYVESPTMGYKDHSSNMDLCPRRMPFLSDVENHVMGYNDHSSNPYIRPRRMIVLDHFPNQTTICALGKYQSMIHQQTINLDHSPQREFLSTNNIFYLDHSPPGECLSTNTLTIHLVGNQLQH